MLRESEAVEFKRSTAELREAVVSLAAMLNKHGIATVYFGIADDGRACGQNIGRQTVRDVTQTIVDNIEPRVFPKVEVREIDGKDCLVVEAEGSHGLYFAYGRAYVRVGESNKTLTAHEIEMRVLKNKKLLWESEPSTNTLADINQDAVKEFARKAISANRIDFEFVDAKTTLNKLGLLNRGTLLRAADVLFCDDNPTGFQAAIFAGTDKLTFLDIKQFKGNLFSLRRQVEIYIGEHIRWRVDLTGSQREEIPEIPVRAISEAIGNALCHRDYSNPKGNEVAIFKDRIEIYNPGCFPEEVVRKGGQKRWSETDCQTDSTA
jgi:ATP-dependent DNA helicase RecG